MMFKLPSKLFNIEERFTELVTTTEFDISILVDSKWDHNVVCHPSKANACYYCSISYIYRYVIHTGDIYGAKP